MKHTLTLSAVHACLCLGLFPLIGLAAEKERPNIILMIAGDMSMKATGDPRASGDGEFFKHYPVWCSVGGRKMGGYNRAGVLEIFPEAEYADWIKKNFPRKNRSSFFLSD